MKNTLNIQNNSGTLFSLCNEKNIYQKFEVIGKKYGDLRESFCRKLYHLQKNAYLSKKYGIQEDNLFWTRLTYKKIAELLNVSLRTAKNVIKDLKEFGIILIGRFKQMLKNFKTGRLMVDNYLAFAIEHFISSPPPRKLSTENPETLVDKGVQDEGYSANFAPSDNKDIPIIKIDNTVGSNYPVDNSFELSDRKSSPNNNQIKFLLKKGFSFMTPKRYKQKCYRIMNPERSSLPEIKLLPITFKPEINESLESLENDQHNELHQILLKWGIQVKKKISDYD